MRELSYFLLFEGLIYLYLPIDVVGLGVLFALELGVAEPELVGVIDFDTGVGGLSFCFHGERKKHTANIIELHIRSM